MLILQFAIFLDVVEFISHRHRACGMLFHEEKENDIKSLQGSVRRNVFHMGLGPRGRIVKP